MRTIGNLPLRGAWLALLLVLMLIAMIAGWRSLAVHLRALLRMLRTRDVLVGAAYALALLAIVLGKIAFARVLLLPTAIVAILVATTQLRSPRHDSTSLPTSSREPDRTESH